MTTAPFLGFLIYWAVLVSSRGSVSADLVIIVCWLDIATQVGVANMQLRGYVNPDFKISQPPITDQVNSSG
jgi:hypothetical protein